MLMTASDRTRTAADRAAQLRSDAFWGLFRKPAPRAPRVPGAPDA